jgi:hypothetical protein
VPIGADNKFRFDNCSLTGAPPPFTVGAVVGGGFTWVIPNRYSVVGSAAAPINLTTTAQVFSIDGVGTVTISKQGATVTRTVTGTVT